MKDFLSVSDFSAPELIELIQAAIAMKNGEAVVQNSYFLALLFEKPSLRTRVSFEAAMKNLGGSSIFLSKEEVQIGKREEIKDVARTLSKMTDCIAIRISSHADLKEFANFSSVPVINALSDLEHPCQALADLMTIYEKFHDFENIQLTYLGDANNVSNSLALASSMVGLSFIFCGPSDYSLSNEIVSQCQEFNKNSLVITEDPKIALEEADVVYTDVWASMGDEDSIEKRKPIFLPYQLNNELLSISKKDSLIMHCLPAKRENEITDEVIESVNSIVFEQAENRLWIQQAIINKLLLNKD